MEELLLELEKIEASIKGMDLLIVKRLEIDNQGMIHYLVRHNHGIEVFEIKAELDESLLESALVYKQAMTLPELGEEEMDRLVEAFINVKRK